MKFLYLVLAILITGASCQELTYEVLLRSSFEDSYVLPVATFFTNSTPNVNEQDQIALKLVSVDWSDQQGIWLDDKVIYVAPPGRFVSDPSINNVGEVIFTEFDQGRNYGIYKYLPDEDIVVLAVSIGGPHNILNFISVVHNESGNILARAKDVFGNQLLVEIDPKTDSQRIVVTEGNSSGLSYIFTPAYNNYFNTVAKVRYGNPGDYNESQPDEILIFGANGYSYSLVEDRDKNIDSQVKKIRNSVAMNDYNQVVFIAEYNNESALYLTDGESTIKIASTLDDDISAIDYFKPAINNNGVIAFRAKDGFGVDVVFVTDGITIFKVAYEGMIIDSDLGPAMIFYDGQNPPFGGSPSLSKDDTVFFSASLRNPDNLLDSYGSSIIKVKIDFGYYYYGR